MVKTRSWYTDRRLERVPQGHVWLEGDNASNSTDSRAYGPVPLAMVRGKVLFKVSHSEVLFGAQENGAGEEWVGCVKIPREVSAVIHMEILSAPTLPRPGTCHHLGVRTGMASHTTRSCTAASS